MVPLLCESATAELPPSMSQVGVRLGILVNVYLSSRAANERLILSRPASAGVELAVRRGTRSLGSIHSTLSLFSYFVNRMFFVRGEYERDFFIWRPSTDLSRVSHASPFVGSLQCKYRVLEALIDETEYNQRTRGTIRSNKLLKLCNMLKTMQIPLPQEGIIIWTDENFFPKKKTLMFHLSCIQRSFDPF